MPRFHFHVTDGRRLYRDPVGVECADLATARRHALQDARALLESWMARSRAPWRIAVVDESARTVLSVSVAEAAVSETAPLFHEPEDLAA
ncbi:MAG TPA: hypothetical protein VGU45_14475 [Microvirga sp.]|jgi:hypothetical protein|nr:hypothetical protein [Microvirga sp.]